MIKKRYKILGQQAQLIESADGNDVNLPSGTEFEAFPNNRSVERLLSMSLLLEVTPEEDPEQIFVVLDEPEPKPKPKAKSRKRRSSND